MDDDVEKTDCLEELDGLINRLLGPLSTEDFNIYDIMAFKDRLALYQALPILFPMAARERVLPRFAAGEMTVEHIAGLACLPAELVQLVLREDWPRLVADLGC